MKIEKIAAAVIALPILCGLCGCAPENETDPPYSVEPSSDDIDESQSEGQSTKANAQSDSDYPTYTLDEVSATKDMMFVERDGVCTALQGDYSLLFNADDWTDANGDPITTNATTSFYSGKHKDARILQVNRAEGDRLLTTEGGDSHQINPVLETGYWPGFEIDWAVEEIDGQASSPADHGIVEFDMHRDGEMFGANNYYLDHVWTTSEKKSFVIGFYRETKWVEETLNIDVPYFVNQDQELKQIWINSAIDFPCEKTKEGYFICNLSDVPAGLYSRYIDGDYCLIEIV